MISLFKKLLKLSTVIPLAALCFPVSAATVYLGSDGKYYDAVSGGAETSYITGDVLGFQTGVTTWNVASNFTVSGGLDAATTAGITANISSGATLTFSTAVMFPTISASSSITFAGDGGLAVGAFTSATTGAVQPTVIIDKNLSVSTLYGNTGIGAVVHFIVAAGRTYENGRFSGGIYLDLQENAHYNSISTAGGVNLDNAGARLNMASGSYINTKLNLRTTNAVVSGKIVVQGGRRVTSDYNYDTYCMIIKGGTTFNAAAEVQQLKADTLQRTTFYDTVNSYAGTGKLVFANSVQLSNTTLNLYTKNAMISGCGAFTEDNVPTGWTQANSTFILNGNPATAAGAKSTVTLNLHADQDFGSFSFMLESIIKVAFNDSVLNVGSFTSSDATGINLWLNGLDERNFFINGMTESEIDNLKLYNAAGTSLLVKNTDYFVYQGSLGGTDGYWVSTVVPEPAEWAAIFGAFALAMALRRRKN